MASIKNLKKDVNFLFGDFIEAVYIWEIANNKINDDASNALIDEAIESFDTFISEINSKNVENRALHLKEVNKNIMEKVTSLVEKLNKLG